MEINLLGVYLTLFIFCCLLAYGGFESTMRLFAYIDVSLRYFWVRLRMFFMKRDLEKRLDLPRSSFIKEMGDILNGK
jgi:hypothetical protein